MDRGMRRIVTWHWMLPAWLFLAAIDLRLWMLVDGSREEALNRARNTLHVSAGIVSQRIEQLLTTYDSMLSGIGESVRLRGDLQATPDLTLHRLLVRRHALNPELRSLFLVRGDGTMAEMSVNFPAPRIDVSDRDYFLAQSESSADRDQLFVGPAIISKVTGQPIIPLSRRVENDGNRFIGVAAAAIAPEQLNRLLAEQELPAGYTLSVFLRDGHPLACLPVRADCLDHPAGQTPLFRTHVAAAPSGVFEHQQLLHEAPGPAAYASSTAYSIVVAATADEQTVLAAWRRHLGAYAAMTVAGNLAFVGLTAFALRQLQRRRLALLQLADANQDLENRVVQRTDQLRRSEDRARTFMNTARDAVVVIDSNSCIVEFNEAAQKMFGYAPAEVMGRRLDMLMPQSAALGHRDHVRRVNTSVEARAMNRAREVSGLHRDGHEFPIDVTIGSSGEGAQSFHVGIIRDISERKSLERELQRQAATDGLTGVLNRRAFTSECERLIAQAQRQDSTLSLMVIDADHFKKVNDLHGHPAGDAVLKALARTLEGGLRASDLIGRLGGEEFGIALPSTSANGVQDVADRLLRAVRALAIEHEGLSLRITVSMGVAVLGPEDSGFEAAFRRADRALYEAKNAGRDRAVIKPG